MTEHLHKHREKYKFTLIELITVIAVIMVLMGMSVGIFSYVTGRAAEARTRALIAKIEVAVESYKAKYGFYPIFPMTALNSNQKNYFNNTSSASRITAFYLEDSWTAFNSLLTDYEGMKTNESATTTTATTPPTRWLIDAYGGPILYRCPGFFNRNSYDIGSFGADGLSGDGQAISEANMGSSSSTNPPWGKGDDITNFTRKQ